MSLIPDRYRCPECDGYMGPMFNGLSSQCKCPPIPDPEMDAAIKRLKERKMPEITPTPPEQKLKYLRDGLTAAEALYAGATSPGLKTYWDKVIKHHEQRIKEHTDAHR